MFLKRVMSGSARMSTGYCSTHLFFAVCQLSRKTMQFTTCNTWSKCSLHYVLTLHNDVLREVKRGFLSRKSTYLSRLPISKLFRKLTGKIQRNYRL